VRRNSQTVRGLVTVRRLVVLLLALAIAGVIFGSTVARAGHYGCHDLGAWVGDLPGLNRSVCYPCPPSTMLPAKTPKGVRLVWDSTVCPSL
jgi:hypothetical protein